MSKKRYRTHCKI